ncbi:hypothetical protein [Streptomyces mirabilis]|uniref:hypothetical protein n=1 Tax=Streptomyces mirabilis TaxID=68239 RepID=UPI0031B9CA0A
MAASLAIRTNLFRLGKPTDTQLKTFLTFVAGGLGTAVTVLGALLTREHNARERWRQQLEAVLRSLEFIRKKQSKHADVAAGVFSSMVLLGHRHAALRTLIPAWDSGKVEPATATWVIGEILAGNDESLEGRRVSPDAMTEAAYVLKKHAEKGELTNERAETYYFPDHFMRAWTTDTKMPRKAKLYLLAAMAETMCSQDKEWWTRKNLPPWPMFIWEECADRDPDPIVRDSAKSLLNAAKLHFVTDMERASPREIDVTLSKVSAWGAPSTED